MIRPILIPVIIALALVGVASGSAADLYQLTTSSARDRHPSWTPSGDAIVFESDRTGRWQLYRISTSGGDPEQLTFADYDHQHPEISPDGTKIAFCRGEASPNGSFLYSGLYVMPVDGGEPTLLVPHNGEIKWHPSWTPDGTTIFFTGTANTWNIYKVPANGGPAILVADFEDEAYTDVSPDGSRLLYATTATGGAYNLVEAPIQDPMQVTYLTNENANTAQGFYSPGGAFIVYTSRIIAGRLELFELDVSQGTSRRLTFDSGFGFDPIAQYPQYSPDGTLIVFSSARITREENIWLLEVGGDFPNENILTVEDAQGLPGGMAVPVTVSLRSSQASPALEFRVTDIPDHLTIGEIRTRGRASGMTASFVENGGIHVLLYNPVGAVISAGSGPILDLMTTVRTQAELGDSIYLELADIVMADVSGDAVEVEATSGSFLVARIPGDINGDNLVDVGDLVRLVEIILGMGDAPSGGELEAADCNGDEAINALDIVCLTDSILGGPAGPSIGDPMATEMDLIVVTDEPVRGIQFEMADGNRLPVATTEIAPLQLYSQPESDRAIAFDPQGGEWSPGSRSPFRIREMPVEIRAYGPGGKPLRVDVSGNEIRIGEPIAAGLTILAPMPNPFRSGTRILFSSDVPTVIRLSVFDIRGRRVSISPEIVVTEGRHAIPWEARDDFGRKLPAGMYIAVIDGGVRRTSVRLTHLGH